MKTISFLPLLFIFIVLNHQVSSQSKKRLRDHGIEIGILKTGTQNAITDVPGVKVGHVTLNIGDSVRTGVTAILPHDGNIFQSKVPAAMYIGNGFGKLMGYSQVEELGNLETPVILTNTLSVPTAAKGLIKYTLNLPGNENVRSVNPIVGETNDGYLNDIRGMHVKEEHVSEAISNATSGPVDEGNVGAGTGTICFGFKGGIGTASRVLPEEMGGYTVGVLIQTNFGGVLEINGTPIGVELEQYAFKDILGSADGSCMIVVFTNAPITSRNLKRLAKRAIMGLAKTGGIASNGSGDYVIAVSTAENLRIPYQSNDPIIQNHELRNNQMSPLFLATIEATEEAIINSLFAANTMEGRNGHVIKALPIDKTLKLLKKYGK
ncbi:P1 family peptidase [Fulvivirgaceae bacterium BMA10]|uniref:P1 family peptidase n=1 Tax=Splendidivirga corallicola TaxID=3051826 RepID=A0ABT8KV48_9BACT|nr:P1 family peptidase [Fulvivirgaceae bacterium BMA10]